MTNDAAGRAYRIQAQILLGIVILYALLTIGVTRSLLSGLISVLTVVILSLLALLVARMTGEHPVSFLEPAFVGGFGFTALVIIELESMPAFEVGISPISSLGSFCVLGAWALHREPLMEGRRVTQWATSPPVLRGALIGFVGGMIFFGIVALISFFGLLVGDEAAFVRSYDDTLAVWLSLLVGGLGAGAVVGALRRLNRWPLGVMLTGTVALTAFATAEEWLRNPGGFARFLDALRTGAAVGVLAGPAVGLMFQGGIGEALVRIVTRNEPA